MILVTANCCTVRALLETLSGATIYDSVQNGFLVSYQYNDNNANIFAITINTLATPAPTAVLLVLRPKEDRRLHLLYCIAPRKTRH